MEILESDHFYHLYNRANGKINIYEKEDDYLHFLQLLNKHINPIGEVYAYCLLPNHFHFLIKIKENIENPSQAFSNLFNAYSKGFNKKYHRTGSLFQRPYKRIKITTEDYLRSLIIYIHCNPELHGIAPNFKRYTYSSYQGILSSSPTSLMREDVISLFHDLENFEFMHERRTEVALSDSQLLE